MKNELPINTVVSYKRLFSSETGRATICGYDISHSKYHAMKHSSWDDTPMMEVKIWLFSNEIVESNLI